MAPFSRQAQLKELDYSKLKAKNSAVMALLYPDRQNCTRLVFIQRQYYKGVHSNQIGFPGGKTEASDSTFLDTALRETEEEIGIKASTVNLIKPLSKLYIPPSNFMVYPFLGYLNYTPSFKLQASEVESVYSFLLSDCIDHHKEVQAEVTASYASKTKVKAFNIENRIVWGATAMMLAEIKALILSSLEV